MAEMNRFAIKFCYQAGLSATETLVLVQRADGNEALNRSSVFRWYSQLLLLLIWSKITVESQQE
jgi:hypothetical protein